MPKSSYEKAIEKEIKAQQRIEREKATMEKAKSIVANATSIDGFRIMDKESEDLLEKILEQYNGNKNNIVEFSSENLPSYLMDSLYVGYNKLELYGVILGKITWMTGANITLSESGKNYFIDKQLALDKAKEKNIVENNKIKNKEYDVFISHANKDKLDYVDDLYRTISKLGIKIFYDSEELSWGENWKQKILESTANSEFAIIVISPNFFDREWTNKELQEFLMRQNASGQKVVLPLLYNITLDELKEKYPELGDIQCVEVCKYSNEMVAILLAKELIKRYKY